MPLPHCAHRRACAHRVHTCTALTHVACSCAAHSLVRHTLAAVSVPLPRVARRCSQLEGRIEFRYRRALAAGKHQVETVQLYPKPSKPGAREVRSATIMLDLLNFAEWNSAVNYFSQSNRRNPPVNAEPQAAAGGEEGEEAEETTAEAAAEAATGRATPPRERAANSRRAQQEQLAAGEEHFNEMMHLLNIVCRIGLDGNTSRTNGDDAAEKLKEKAKEKADARKARADKLEADVRCVPATLARHSSHRPTLSHRCAVAHPTAVRAPPQAEEKKRKREEEEREAKERYKKLEKRAEAREEREIAHEAKIDRTVVVRATHPCVALPSPGCVGGGAAVSSEVCVLVCS